MSSVNPNIPPSGEATTGAVREQLQVIKDELEVLESTVKSVHDRHSIEPYGTYLEAGGVEQVAGSARVSRIGGDPRVVYEIHAATLSGVGTGNIRTYVDAALVGTHTITSVSGREFASLDITAHLPPDPVGNVEYDVEVTVEIVGGDANSALMLEQASIYLVEV